MAIHPVILCGGAGTRLWPASRAERPKQFLALTGDRSLFQDTVLRAAPLADGGLIVVAGQAHEAALVEQLAEIGAEARLILEPEGRDSAPAMAAAALAIAARDPDGVAVFLASDHHIPDVAAFQRAVLEAAEAAEAGRIVTLGVRPENAATAYGYIKPAGEGLSPVSAFREKPDAATARAYVEAGYLWNSGNFVVRADVVLSELERFAPGVPAAAKAALAGGEGATIRLGEPFRAAPKISIDYAVMEKSERVSVLPVAFSWSDLGAWDAVVATGSGGRGRWLKSAGDRALVRAAPGMTVATAGVEGLAIIAEPDAVLVCRLDRAQEVKGLHDRWRAGEGREADAEAAPSLEEAIGDFDAWMRLSALPLWLTVGRHAAGQFAETISLDGAPDFSAIRGRVQPRQVGVYAVAGTDGWAGPWREAVETGLELYERTNRRADGLARGLTDGDGGALDEAATLYDQTFALLAWAEAARAGVRPDGLKARAHQLADVLDGLRLDEGWRELSPPERQANPHMHLLEACLAWDEVEPDARWREMAGDIARLAKARLVDRATGAIRERFDDAWRPLSGDRIEPGHQFEWAWLLTRWSALSGDLGAAETARTLYAAGLRGVDPGRGVVVDSLASDQSDPSPQARLWGQTEWLKTALILAESGEGAEREGYLADARRAMAAVDRYRLPHGLWRDKLMGDGRFVQEAAPASTLYHLMAALRQARAFLDQGVSGRPSA